MNSQRHWLSAAVLTFLAVLMGASMVPAALAAPYGTAVVEQGRITVLRDGKPLTFVAGPREITVNEGDTVRVRENSRMVLKTRDKATVRLGSNAVFQCEPWAAGAKSGTFRMLFGRMRADVQGLAGNDRFNVKTATATIGVKGTQYGLALSSAGNTAVLGIESTVVTAGPDGVEQPIGPNQMSTVVGGNAATPAVTAPEEFKADMAKIDSPPFQSLAALSLPAEAVLVEKGIVSKEALIKSKEDKGKLQEGGAETMVPTQLLNLDDTEPAGQSLHGSENPKPRK